MIPILPQEDPSLKKLYQAVERFCARHPRFGIPNLIRYVVIGNVVVYFLMMLTRNSDAGALSFLSFNLSGLLRGEIWRLVTFILVPGYSGPFWLLIALYFYYWIGSTLEREWGTARFNLYYFSGVLLTVLGTVLASLITGNYGLTIAGADYVNLSMFLAFAVLFPNVQVLLFFILPVKMKWLAWLDGALFAIGVVRSLMAGNVTGVVLPLVALLNFFVFIWPTVRNFAERKQYQHSRQTVQFKHAVQRQQQERGYHHKCAVCGRTDADHPELQFRYCSKCAGYHCFCQDHIFSHVHFTEED
jgi:membrane associated rhomboid family serine protease